MEKHGWEVKKHYHLDTAWVATFSHGNGGRVLGINSEMDALPGVGHACGHNLIAIAGVAVAFAVKAALIAHGIPGKVVLLGTPGICHSLLCGHKALRQSSRRRRSRQGHPPRKRGLQGNGRMFDAGLRPQSDYVTIS
jgi:hypothetical protein